MKARGDGFGIGGFLVLDDDPFACFGSGGAECGFGFGDFHFHGLLAGCGGSGERLGGDGDRFHVFVQQGDVQFAVFLGDFAVHGFVGAEFEDAAFVRSEFDSFVSERETGGDNRLGPVDCRH